MTSRRDGDRDAEQLAVVEEILAELRHDVRNKLSAIGQACEYLRRRVEPTEVWTSEKRVPRFFAVVAEQLLVVDAMLEAPDLVARIHRRAPAPLDPVTLAAGALVGVQLGEVSLETAIAPGPLHGDPCELAFALRQLLQNAATASPAGGTVRLDGAPLATDAYAFVVRDQGPGLSPADFDRLVRPFESTDAGRRGLGLSMARRIAQRWGGDIRCAPASSGAMLELVVPASRRQEE